MTRTTGKSVRRKATIWAHMAAILLSFSMIGTAMGAPRWDQGVFYGPGGVGTGGIFLACLDPSGPSRYVLGWDDVHQVIRDHDRWLERSNSGVTGIWDIKSPYDGVATRSWRTDPVTSVRNVLQIDKIVFPVDVDIDCSTLRTGNATELKIRPVKGTKPLKAIAVYAGSRSTCAILDDHSVRCWGSELGLMEGRIPVPAVTAMGGLNGNECVIAQGGEVSCWADSNVVLKMPRKVPGLAHVKSLGRGTALCGIRDDNSLFCTDAKGHMGAVPGVPSAIDVAGDTTYGTRHCAVVPGGDVVCWGDLATHNPVGEEEAVVKSEPPTRVSFVHDAVKVVGSDCALLRDTSITCWQYRSDSEAVAMLPRKTAPLTGFRDIASGGDTCGMLIDGRVKCRLFDRPVLIPGVEHAIAISVGEDQGCAVIEGGGIRCWGQNRYGTLGSLANRGAPNYDDSQYASHAPIGFVNYREDGQ